MALHLKSLAHLLSSSSSALPLEDENSRQTLPPFSPALLGTGVGYNLHCGCPRVLQPQVSSMTLFCIYHNLFLNLVIYPFVSNTYLPKHYLLSLWLRVLNICLDKLWPGSGCTEQVHAAGTTLFPIDRLNVARRAWENHFPVDISVLAKPPASNSLMRILWEYY